MWVGKVKDVSLGCPAFKVLTPSSTYFQFYHLYVLFVEISYQARFYLQISYSSILFTMLIGFLNRGSFIIYILLLGMSKLFTFSVFCWVHAFTSFCRAHDGGELINGSDQMLPRKWYSTEAFVEKKSNIGILRSKHTQGFESVVNCCRDAGNVCKKFQTVFPGHVNDFAKDAYMLKKWRSPTLVFYAPKDCQTCARVWKHRQLFAGC